MSNKIIIILAKDCKYSGYFQSLSKGVYAIVYRNNAKFRVVDWGFKSIDDWKTTRNKTHNLLNNRKW